MNLNKMYLFLFFKFFFCCGNGNLEHFHTLMNDHGAKNRSK